MLLVGPTPYQCPCSPAVVRAVLRMPEAQLCWAQPNQGRATQSSQSAKHQVIKNKTPFQQPFIWPISEAGSEQSHTNGAPTLALICVSGREEKRRIRFDSGEMVNESIVQWLLIAMLSGYVAAENSRLKDSFSDSLLATHLSKEPNAMDDYRLLVIHETVTTMVAAIGKKF